MEIAYKRAYSFYKPKLSFAFLELFLPSRAFSQGAKLGNPETLKCDIQHGSYCREKTFILMDPEREFRGKPDNILLPVPDYFFVGGELCRDILVEDGFSERKIFITGSTRFDYIQVKDGTVHKNGNFNPLKVLLVLTLNIELEFEMVRAAFCAAKGLNIKLFLRSHWLNRMEDAAFYKPYSKYITSRFCSSEDDLREADLILFTYSSVAEEAFLRGIPIFQWRTPGFNGSVFRDIKIIPVFYSIGELRNGFMDFLNHPAHFTPTREFQELVLSKCFYKTDGQAALRIANEVFRILPLEQIRNYV